ncbi:hypothetical protein OBRU01_23114, partial [Operophtera brumata]
TDGQSAKCKTCDKIIKTGGGSTSALHTHFRSVHSNIASTDSTPSTSSAADISGTSKENQLATETKKRKLMSDYYKSSESMEVIVSRMTALDGCTFRLFTESQDQRNVFKKSGLELPKSPNTIAKIVLTQADEDDSESESDSDDNRAELDLSGSLEVETPAVRANPALYREIITKVRKLVKSIKKSPLKADALRNYVLKEHGKDIQLELDCRTRWSSMSDMIGLRLLLAGVLHYLHDWEDFSTQDDDDTFPKPNGDEISDTITNLLQQLKYKPKDSDPSISVVVSERSVPSSPSNAEVVAEEELTLQEQLDKALNKCKTTRKNRSDFDLTGFVLWVSTNIVFFFKIDY